MAAVLFLAMYHDTVPFEAHLGVMNYTYIDTLCLITIQLAVSNLLHVQTDS